MMEFLTSATLLLVLINPFFLIIYLVDMVETLDQREFSRVMIRAGLIASAVFICFALLGDVIFTHLIHVEFASFQIFGGLVFLLIGLQFVFQGPRSLEILRGKSEHLAGAVAMPVLIGPGSVSASVVVGQRLDPLLAAAAVLLAVAVSIAFIMVLKAGHDFIRPRNERLIKRYIEIAGRIMALIVGTIAVQMIMQGIRTWAGMF